MGDENDFGIEIIMIITAIETEDEIETVEKEIEGGQGIGIIFVEEMMETVAEVLGIEMVEVEMIETIGGEVQKEADHLRVLWKTNLVEVQILKNQMRLLSLVLSKQGLIGWL